MNIVRLLVLVIFGFAQVSVAEVDCSKMSTNELNQALISAVERGCFDQVQKLLAAGADINGEITVTGSHGRGEGCMDYRTDYKLLEYASLYGYIDIVRELIKAGAGNCPDAVYPSLIGAARQGHLDLLRELIIVAANLKHPDWAAADLLINKALVAAAYEGQLDVMLELIKAGANINYVHGYLETTALIEAAEQGHVDVVKELVKMGADLNYVDKNGEAALFKAVKRGRLDVVKELIGAGAYVNLANRAGDTALMYAIKEHNFDLVQSLLLSLEFHPGIWQLIKELFLHSEHKPINYADKDGNTALILAIKNLKYRYFEGDKREYNDCVNSQRILEELLNFPGVDHHHVNKKGETAIILLEELQRKQNR